MTTAIRNSAETIQLFEQYVIPNYGRFPVSLVRGEGSFVWDAEGNRFLDLFPGWGVQSLGTLPTQGCKSRPGATRDFDPCTQYVVHRTARGMGQDAVRTEFPGTGLFL